MVRHVVAVVIALPMLGACGSAPAEPVIDGETPSPEIAASPEPPQKIDVDVVIRNTDVHPRRVAFRMSSRVGSPRVTEVYLTDTQIIAPGEVLHLPSVVTVSDGAWLSIDALMPTLEDPDLTSGRGFSRTASAPRMTCEMTLTGDIAPNGIRHIVCTPDGDGY